MFHLMQQIHHPNDKDTKYSIPIKKCANQNTKYANLNTKCVNQKSKRQVGQLKQHIHHLQKGYKNQNAKYANQNTM